jgi:hypothetical protein
VTLKILDLALVPFRGSPGLKSAEISTLARFRVLFFRVQAILAGFQFSNHDFPPLVINAKYVPFGRSVGYITTSINDKIPTVIP